VSTLPFRVALLDPAILAAATLTLVAVALIACCPAAAPPAPIRRSRRDRRSGTSRTRRCLTLHEASRRIGAQRPPQRVAAVRLDSATEAAMPDQPRPSHELFHEHRTRCAPRATGGTSLFRSSRTP
jgi:hypothetical protein